MIILCKGHSGGRDKTGIYRLPVYLQQEHYVAVHARTRRLRVLPIYLLWKVEMPFQSSGGGVMQNCPMRRR